MIVAAETPSEAAPSRAPLRHAVTVTPAVTGQREDPAGGTVEHVVRD